MDGAPGVAEMRFTRREGGKGSEGQEQGARYSTTAAFTNKQQCSKHTFAHIHIHTHPNKDGKERFSIYVQDVAIRGCLINEFCVCRIRSFLLDT